MLLATDLAAEPTQINFLCPDELSTVVVANSIADGRLLQLGSGCRTFEGWGMPNNIGEIREISQVYARNGQIIEIGRIDMLAAGLSGWSAGVQPEGLFW